MLSALQDMRQQKLKDGSTSLAKLDQSVAFASEAANKEKQGEVTDTNQPDETETINVNEIS